MKRVSLIIILLFPLLINAQTITTVAGNGINGDSGNGGIAISASINRPYGGVFDSKGNFYFVESNSNRVRKTSPCGIIDAVAGTGVAGFSGDSALAATAELNSPRWVATDTHNNIYIADGDNYRIRKIDTAGIIYTIAGNGVSAYSGDSGQAISASFIQPSGICIDSLGNIYIADDARIRKIDTSGIITTVAGNGTVGFSGDSGLATSAEIHAHGIYIDKSGNLFIADFYRIRVVNAITGVINTIAGTGISPYNGDGIPAISANFNTIGLVWDSIGNIYTADLDNNRVREIDTFGIIHTIAGTGIAGFSGDGGLADTATMYDPSGVAFDPCGNLLVPCKENFRIRKIIFDSSCNNCNPLSVNVANNHITVSIYPNPATTELTITSPNKINNITIANILGQTLQTEITNTEKAEINIAALPSGIYFVKVICTDNISSPLERSGEVSITKIVKQ